MPLQRKKGQQRLASGMRGKQLLRFVSSKKRSSVAKRRIGSCAKHRSKKRRKSAPGGSVRCGQFSRFSGGVVSSNFVVTSNGFVTRAPSFRSTSHSPAARKQACWVASTPL